MNNNDMYTDITTDYLMFDLEPGISSKTKIAIGLAKKLSEVDSSSLSSAQLTRLTEIRTAVSGFLN